MPLSTSSRFFLPLAMSLLFVGGGAFPAIANALTPAPSTQELKQYLISNLHRITHAAGDFVTHGKAYAALCQQHGTPAAAWQQTPAAMQALLLALREDYKTMDSFGYEAVEGIVAGVDCLAPYDLYLDAGLPAGADPQEVSPLVLRLGTGETIAHAGSSFTFIIEPMLWSTNARWGVPADRNGDGRCEAHEALPRPELLTAIAEDTRTKLVDLLREVEGWQPTAADCLKAIISMAPVLSTSFEEWREAGYSEARSGRYSAVSRLSDLRGIVQSCTVMFEVVHPLVRAKDEPLARLIRLGLEDVTLFLSFLENKERTARRQFQPVVVDEAIRQAQAKADRLAPQLKQAAALLGIEVAGR